MKKLFRELLSLTGFLSTTYGIYQIHEPAAFIVAGGFLVWVSIQGRTK